MTIQFSKYHIYYLQINMEVFIVSHQGHGYGAGFALIVVLFILLIIVGSAYIW